MSKATLLQGDCLELMNRIPDSSIDMVLSDLLWHNTLPVGRSDQLAGVVGTVPASGKGKRRHCTF